MVQQQVVFIVRVARLYKTQLYVSAISGPLLWPVPKPLTHTKPNAQIPLLGQAYSIILHIYVQGWDCDQGASNCHSLMLKFIIVFVHKKSGGTEKAMANQLEIIYYVSKHLFNFG